MNAVSSRLELSVIAPCHNEADNVAELAKQVLTVFHRHELDGELILIDDASRDDTAARIAALAEANPGTVIGLYHPVNQGIEGGWRSGVGAARGRFVVLIDADLQNPPQEIWRLYRQLKASKADVVQGVRSSIGRLRDGRYLLSRGLNVLLNVCFGMRARDNKSGFIITERETLRDLLAHRGRYNFFQTFVRVAAEAKGYEVEEVETLFVERQAGQSFINPLPLRVIGRVLADLPRALIEYRWRGRPSEPLLRLNLATHPSAHPERVSPHLPLWRRALRALYFHSMPLHAWMITSRTRHLYQLLLASQWQSPAALRALQEAKLRRLIRHAYHQVPYYRERMRALDLTPTDIRSLNDLGKLPLLSKADVRANLHFDLFSDDHDKQRMLRVTTSGSTGEPFTIYADRHQLEMRFATTLRAMEWTGWRFGDRQVRLWHQTLGMSWTQAVRERLDAWLMRRLFIPAFEMREATMAATIERMRRHRPVLVDGYAESFDYLVRHAEAHGLEPFRPAAIMSSGQILADQTRAAISRYLGARSFDKYGAREFSGIAYECDHAAGHHVMAESYIVEILKDGRPALPGEVGEVVVTDLNNFSVPLIRYRVGDLAEALDESTPCPCGRGLPRIGRIQGRAQAVILTPDGRWIPGTFFSHFFKDHSSVVRQFQVIQETRAAMTLRIAKSPTHSSDGMRRMMEELAGHMGPSITISVAYCDEIPLLATGKTATVIQKIPIEFQSLGTGSSATGDEN
ncbi:glycosyltransferase [Azospirillum sp. B4]|uniref:glycosyltransferase n=1 Tax=Azospirillum sp. B4 TaxID=95605 RepID=UPI0005C9ED1F|nr:glycosyltransferase [Azospirillum sp. B4]